MEQRKILCIDLKTFYASCECVMRNLDPFKTNLVVADKERGNGTICLAVSPAMKALGVKNRCRLFDIPKDIKYIAAKPQMKKYIEYSANIYGLYLKYFSKDDIFVYSIDECFIDVTNYLKLYKTDELTLGKRLLKDIFDTFGLTATLGIGSNLFLAKIGLDILSKHRPDNIGIVDEKTFEEELIFHEPLTDFWNIGRGTAKRLAKYKVNNLYRLRLLEDEILKKEFGVKGQILKDHAFGIEPTTIKEIKDYKPTNKSLSSGQVLFKDYNFEDALLVTKEMIEMLGYDLIDSKLVTNSVSLGIGYSKNEYRPTGGSVKFDTYTNSITKLKDAITAIYTKTTNKKYPIRRISVAFGSLLDEAYLSNNLFDDTEKLGKELDLNKAIISIHKKYGKDKLLKGSDYLDNATTRERIKLIGGHNG